MAFFTVDTRALKSGEKRFKVTITHSVDGIIHRYSKSFKKKKLADIWGKNQVAEVGEFDVVGYKVC